MPLESKILDGSENNLSLLKNASFESILTKVKRERESQREKGQYVEPLRREVGIPMEIDFRFDMMINNCNTNMTDFCIAFTEYSWYGFLIILFDNSIDLKDLYDNHHTIKTRGGRDSKLAVHIRRSRLDKAEDLITDTCYFDRKIYSQIKKLSKYFGSNIASLIRIVWYVGIQKIEKEGEIKDYGTGIFTNEIEEFIEYLKSRAMTAKSIARVIEEEELQKGGDNIKSDKK